MSTLKCNVSRTMLNTLSMGWVVTDGQLRLFSDKPQQRYCFGRSQISTVEISNYSTMSNAQRVEYNLLRPTDDLVYSGS